MTVTCTAAELAAADDAAVPYAMDGDTRLRAKLWPISTTASGGINTSMAGFANWLRLHLDKGEFEGQRLLSPGLIREMQTPRVHVMASEFAEIGDVHYGLGFGLQSYRGERVVTHGGGWIGWSTLMTMLPERGVGVAVFTNRDSSPVPDLLVHFVLDRVCGKELVPWLDRYRERRRKGVAQLDVDRQARKALRRPNTRPSHDLADYAGDYAHPGYGRMAITHAGDELRWEYRGMSEPLAHRHYDTFELPEASGRLLPDRLAISFSTDREGNIAMLSAPLEPLVKDIGRDVDPAARRARHDQLDRVIGIGTGRQRWSNDGSAHKKHSDERRSQRLLTHESSTFRGDIVLWESCQRTTDSGDRSHSRVARGCAAQVTHEWQRTLESAWRRRREHVVILHARIREARTWA